VAVDLDGTTRIHTVTLDEIARLVGEYSAGLEAELHLLHRLEQVASEQHAGSRQGEFVRFGDAADERDKVMWNLVRLEEHLRVVRHALAEHPELTAEVPGFDDVVAKHRDAVALVNRILATDQASLSALADAELARRSAVAGLERGETTLAAYRRVLAPPVGAPTLLNKRG
jgi:hypothetical protein